MGQSVEVVVMELLSAAGRLGQAGQRLQDGLSSVDLEVGQLLGSGWRGEAASAYGTAWDRWHDGAGQVVRGLQTMSDLLTVTGKEYAKIDEQSAGAIGSSFHAPGGGSSGNATETQGGGGSASGVSGASGASDAGSANGAGRTSADARQAMSPVPQLGQAVQPLAQAGQAATGIVQQAAQLAAQMAIGLARQAGDGEDQREDDAAREKEQRAGDRSDVPEERDGAVAGAAASGDRSAPTAHPAPAESATARPSASGLPEETSR